MYPKLTAMRILSCDLDLPYCTVSGSVFWTGKISLQEETPFILSRVPLTEMMLILLSIDQFHPFLREALWKSVSSVLRPHEQKKVRHWPNRTGLNKYISSSDSRGRREGPRVDDFHRSTSQLCWSYLRPCKREGIVNEAILTDGQGWISICRWS